VGPDGVELLSRRGNSFNAQNPQQRRSAGQQPKAARQARSRSTAQSKREPIQLRSKAAPRAYSATVPGNRSVKIFRRQRSPTQKNFLAWSRIPPADPPTPNRPACVGSGCGSGETPFHTPRQGEKARQGLSCIWIAPPWNEDRPVSLLRCSGPGILASSAGAEVTRATSVLSPRTPAGKNHQICAKTILASQLHGD